MPRKPIKDEFTDLPISRQRKRQLRLIRDGKCRICGKAKEPERQQCPTCLKLASERQIRWLECKRAGNAS
jgi:uncharacterized OB-fold protein